MNQINIEDAKTILPELIEAAINGEEIVIAKDEQHVVKLVPISQPNRARSLAAPKA
jgi:antitoxin (DNA-binding transcriptional repressor) of toxin-antitoxin stability system